MRCAEARSVAPSFRNAELSGRIRTESIVFFNRRGCPMIWLSAGLTPAWRCRVFFSKIRAILSIYAVMVFAIVGLYAQTGQGTIVGLVSDSTGARIVSVAVRVTNKETS